MLILGEETNIRTLRNFDRGKSSYLIVYLYIYILEKGREKIWRLCWIDFVEMIFLYLLTKKIVSLNKGLRNVRFYIEREYTKTIIMFDTNIRSLLSVSFCAR